MPASSAAAPHSASPSQQQQAATLWTFIKAKQPRFTYDDALAVVQDLQPRPGDDPKKLARELQQALRSHGITLKYVNALQVASQVNQHASWHKNPDATLPRLRFATLNWSGSVEDFGKHQDFANWDQVAEALCAWADGQAAAGAFALGVLSLQHDGDRVLLRVPQAQEPGAPTPGAQLMTVAGVTPTDVADLATWREGAAGAFEKLRRHLEERGLATLDGLTVLELCARRHEQPGSTAEWVGLPDLPNCELVLLRQDEDDPQGGYEVARGDEVGCWHQLELAMQDDATGAMPALDISVPEEGAGCWRVNGQRYVWAMETLKPGDFTPGRNVFFLGPKDCQRLLRRYRLAKRLHAGGFKFHEQTKQLSYLGGVPQAYRLDIGYVRQLLAEANLTWEQYCKEQNEDLPLQEEMPAGFIFSLLERTRTKDVNKVFLLPRPDQLVTTDVHAFLRALMPRMSGVRWTRPPQMDAQDYEQLKEAVGNFSTALKMRGMLTHMGPDRETPYMLFISDIDELLGTAESLGLQVHAAVVPYLLPVPEELLAKVAGMPMWPWAPGWGFFLRFVREGAAQ